MNKSSSSFLSDATRQALTARRRLIANKELVPYSSLQKELVTKWSTFERATFEGRILVLCVDGQNYLPAFYLDSAIDHLRLEKVVKSLGNLDSWTKWQFLTTRKLTLNGATPLEALREGKLKSVLNAAISFSEL